MRVAGFSALIAGIGAIIALVLYQGAGDVAAAIAAVGWGLVFVILSRLLPIALDGYVWRLLFPKDTPRPVLLLLWARWIGEGVNTLMPAFQVGGALVRTRLLVLHRFPGRIVGASVVVDLTLSTLTQLLFTLVGVGLLLAHYGNNDIAKGAGAGVGLGLLLVIGFCVFQHRGLFGFLVGLVSRVSKGRDWVSAVGGAAALDEAIRDLYRRRWALTLNAAGQMLAWALGAAEISEIRAADPKRSAKRVSMSPVTPERPSSSPPKELIWTVWLSGRIIRSQAIVTRRCAISTPAR